MECGEFKFVSFYDQPRRESGLVAAGPNPGKGFDLDQALLKE